MGQKTGDKEQSSDTGDRDEGQGAEQLNRGQKTGDKEQSSETGDGGRRTKYKDVREGTRDVR